MKSTTPRKATGLACTILTLLLLAVSLLPTRSAPPRSIEPARFETAQLLSAAPASSPQEQLRLSDRETHPNAKTLASRIAIALTTYDAGEGPEDIAARLALSGVSNAPAVSATLYHPGAWSRARIVYPQLGGLLADRASIMVVVEQQIGTPEGVRIQTRTLDIRLRIVDGAWQFEELVSAGGQPVPMPANLPAEALAVLGHPNIVMPDSARWDIHSGEISTTLLGVIAKLADRAPIGITTLTTGHPWEIFGTDRMSDHSRGLAVDIYRIGDRPVIEEHASDSVTYALSAWLSRLPGVARLGSPWKFDAATAITFTDALHQDHLHVAVPRNAP